jgi:hypothetical protein
MSMFIAIERMKVGDGYREHGDPIPEAAEWSWQTRAHYLRNHRIAEVPDPAPAKKHSKSPAQRDDAEAESEKEAAADGA